MKSIVLAGWIVVVRGQAQFKAGFATMSDEIPIYNWWGSGENEPPEKLKTKRQLGEMGLRPIKAVGVIHCREYDCLLYDPNNLESARPKGKPTQKQLEVLAANREKQQRNRDYEEWYRNYGFIECDRAAAVRWARKILDSDDWAILDTETTGLGDAEVVEIAIIDRLGEPLLNTLIKATIPIPGDSTNIHGITDEMVATAATFSEVYPLIAAALQGKQVLIYNSSFDIRVLGYTRRLHGLPSLGLRARSDCIMEWYSQWQGVWSSTRKSYRWQRLPGGGHRAMADCIAALECIKKMAQDSPEIEYPLGIYPPTQSP